MTLRISVLAGAALALSLCGGTQAWAGETGTQIDVGVAFFAADEPCAFKKFPVFETLAPIPKIIDPFEQDLIPVFCYIQVQRDGQGVRKAGGAYTSELVVIDNNTGMAERFPLKAGNFRTNSSGLADFDFDLPAELFADGFESGDVSAWSYTRTDFTNRKKADHVRADCGASSSSSSNRARRIKDPRGPSR